MQHGILFDRYILKYHEIKSQNDNNLKMKQQSCQSHNAVSDVHLSNYFNAIINFKALIKEESFAPENHEKIMFF